MQQLLDHGLARAATWLVRPRWRLWVTGACILSALCWQVPNYGHLYQQLVHGYELESNLEVFKQQIAEPFVSHNDLSRSHEAKMAYRLALPLLARLLHISVPGILLAQFLLGGLMYYVLLRLLESLVADRLAAALVALGLSCTYFGSAFSFDQFGYFDAFCYALLVFLFSVRQGWLVFALCLVGTFIDERMLPASLLAVYWYGWQHYGWAPPGMGRFLSTRPARAVYAAWLAWAGLRLGLWYATHLPVYGGLVGIVALRESLALNLVSLGVVSGLKSYWLLPVLVAVLLLYYRHYRLLGWLALCAVPIFGGALLVMDTTRSLSYGLPLIFICLSMLKHYSTPAELRRLALSLAFFAWLIPSYHIMGHILYASPFYLTILKIALKANVPHFQ